ATRRGGRLGALDAHGQPPAADAVAEGLGVGADDGRDVHRRAPVVAVPPDAVAVVDVHVGGALRRLDAVDVEEPVDRAPVRAPAGVAVDGLDEVAAVARAYARVAPQQAHDGLVAGALGRGRLQDGACAEVLGDGQRDAAGR